MGALESRGGLGSSLPAEDVLGVAGPDLVLTLVGAGEGAGARGTARHHVEARLGQLVESLLQEVELEVIARGIALRRPVGVPALVQGVPKHFLGQRGLAAHGDARHSPELGVRLRVPPNSVGATVADGDVARASAPVQRLGRREQRTRCAPGRAAARQLQRGRRRSGGGAFLLLRLRVAERQQLVSQRALLLHPAPGVRRRPRARLLGLPEAAHEFGQLEVLGLTLQPAALGEVVGQHELQVPQVIQDVTEEEAVSVQKEAAFAVPGQLLRLLLREHAPEQRLGHGHHSAAPSHIHLAPHVQLHDIGEERRLRGGGRGAATAPATPVG